MLCLAHKISDTLARADTQREFHRIYFFHESPELF